MRKIILGLFIVLLCFSMGVAELQEEELSNEEKVKAEFDIKIDRYLKLLNRPRLEKLSKEELIIEILDLKEFIKVDQLAIKLLEELVEMKEEKERDLLELMKEASEEKAEKDVYELIFEESKKQREEEKKKELSYWDGYEAAAVDYFKSIGVWKTDPEKLEEENDRLEDLLRELRNEKSELEWNMMRYRSDLEWHMLELSSRLESDLLFNPLLTFPFDYRYTYPTYSKKRDRTNYEPLLFTLCTDSKGKMDWTKYGWLKIWLKNK